MARKPRARVDTSRLRAMGGQQAVVARPVDSYVRPAPVQENRQATQLLNALSTLNPAIQNFIDVRTEEISTEQTQKGEKSFYEATPEERDEVAKKIRNGEIDETQSPFWVEGFARSLLRNHAKDFGDNLILEWDKEKDKAGFDFADFVSEQRKDYVEANQLSGFRADIFNDEFGDVTQRFEAQVQQRNFEHRLQKAREARLQSFVGEMDTTLSNLDDMIDAGTFNAADATATVNSLLQSAMDQGNDRTAVINAAVGFLEGKALEIARNGGHFEDILTVLEGIKLKGSTYGIANKDKIERLRNQLIDDRDQAERDEYNDETLNRAERARELSDKLHEGLVENKFSQSWYDSEETRALRAELQRLDPTKMNVVDTYYQQRGEVIQGGDISVFNGIATQIDKGFDQESVIEAAFENQQITYNQKITLQNANQGIYSQFVQENGIQGMPTSVGQAVKQTSGFESLLSDATRNDLASQAQAEMFGFIREIIPAVESGDMSVADAKAKIFAEQTKIIEKYREIGKQRAMAGSLPNVPTASEDEVVAWQQGDSPWIGADETWTVNMDDAGAMWDAAKKVLEDPSKANNWLTTTDLGKMVAPLVKAGEDPDAIIRRFAKEYIAELNRLAGKSEEVIPDVVVDPDAAITNAEDEAADALEAEATKYDLTSVMSRTGLSTVLNMPPTYEPTSVSQLTTGSGGFSGFYLYEDANGMKMISAVRPDKYNLTPNNINEEE